MTRAQAEAKLRDLISEGARAPPPVAEGMTVEQVGSRLHHSVEREDARRRRSRLRELSTRPSGAALGETPVSEITVDDVEDFIEQCLAEHRSSTQHYLGALARDLRLRDPQALGVRARAGSPRSRSPTASIATSAFFSTPRSSRRCSRHRHSLSPQPCDAAARRTCQDPEGRAEAAVEAGRSDDRRRRVDRDYLSRREAGRGLSCGRGHAAC